MNKQLTKLFEVAQKKERLIVGLMSGTSLDGLDVALCKITASGKETSINVLEFETWAYSDVLRRRLRSIQSKEETDTRELTLLHSELGFLYGDVILGYLQKWDVDLSTVDLAASHGQTVFHAPAQNDGDINSTLQMVDGDHIAQKTGLITVSDFRQKHTAEGGEGAPLAAIFDEMMFRSESGDRMLLNLGGIANLTWLPAEKSGAEIITGDIGPANTLINEAMQKYFDRDFDEGGEVARRGKVHSGLVRYVLLEPYFRKTFPKTTGQEDFKLDYIEDLMQGHSIELSNEDLVASLTAITSQSVSRAAEQITHEQKFDLFVSGGGVHNQAIMDDLKVRIPRADFRDLKDFGFTADAKEASMIAFFANELVAGEGFRIPGFTKEKIHLGKISLP